MTFAFTISRQDDRVTLTLSGSLTYIACSAMPEMIRRVQEIAARTVVVDVSALSFLDTEGEGALLITIEAVRRAHRSIEIRGGTGEVERLLTRTGVQSGILLDAY
ncbi:STAS domain-containing protein [Azospirillum sp. sgz302134]